MGEWKEEGGTMTTDIRFAENGLCPKCRVPFVKSWDISLLMKESNPQGIQARVKALVTRGIGAMTHGRAQLCKQCHHVWHVYRIPTQDGQVKDLGSLQSLVDDKEADLTRAERRNLQHLGRLRGRGVTR